MAYQSLPLKKKNRTKGTIAKLNDSPSIYSTLSKKPADLETTDIDLSAIRIFLGDGSHRTLSSTPSTQCGEILDRLLEKLGLSEQREKYSLQIHYKYSEPRLPNDDEEISSLNIHVYDSVDKIYLYKISDTFVMMPLRKRVASYSKRDSEAQEENIYENCAVGLGYCRESDYQKSFQPVVVNDKLACNFAKAWTVVTDANNEQCKEVIPIETPPQIIAAEDRNLVVSPTSYSSYTIDRKHKKTNTLRRQKPIRSTPNTRSPQLPPNVSSSSQHASHFKPINSPKRTFNQSLSSSSYSSLSPDIVVSDTEDLYSEIGPLISNPLHKSVSEGCLLSACDSEKTELKKSSSVEIHQRDSGFHDASPPTPPKHEQLRRKSISLNDIPQIINTTLFNHSKSVPLLALHAAKAHTKSDSIDSTNGVFPSTTVNASSLKSYKSMELLSGDDFEAIGENIGNHTTLTAQPHEPTLDSPPSIPKRNSSFLNNYSISDDYLLKQGKRLSQVLNINVTVKSEEKGHIRSFFAKVGTMLTRRKRNPSSLSTASVQSPQSPRPTMSPFDASLTCPFPSNRSPSSPISGTLLARTSNTQDFSTSPGRLSEEDEYDIVVPQPLDQVKEKNPYDVAISQLPVPLKTPIPDYLRIIPADGDTSSIYGNHEMEDTHFYQTPPFQPHQHSLNDEHDLYKNKFIQKGANGSITLDGSMLNDYQIPPPPSAETRMSYDNELYENNAIKRGANGAITFNSRNLHDYQTPPSRTNAIDASNTPPPLPSKELYSEPNLKNSNPPSHELNISSTYKEHVADWVQSSPNLSTHEIYDVIADGDIGNIYDYIHEGNDMALERTQSEPDLIYEIPGEYDSSSEDEYMTMQPNICHSTEALDLEISYPSKPFKRKSRASKFLRPKGPPPPPKVNKLSHLKAQSRVKEIRAKLMSGNNQCNDHSSHSRGNKQHTPKSTLRPLIALGAPPKFIPIAPKPKAHKLMQIQHSAVQNKVPTSSIPLIATISGNVDSLKGIRNSPPNTLKFKKVSPISALTTPFLSPPSAFKASSVPIVKKKPIFPPNLIPVSLLPPPIVTSSSHQQNEVHIPPAISLKNESFLTPPRLTPSTPPPNTKPLPVTPSKQTNSTVNVSEITANLEKGSCQCVSSPSKPSPSTLTKPEKTKSLPPTPPPPPPIVKPLMTPAQSLPTRTLPFLPVKTNSTSLSSSQVLTKPLPYSGQKSSSRPLPPLPIGALSKSTQPPPFPPSPPPLQAPLLLLGPPPLQALQGPPLGPSPPQTHPLPVGPPPPHGPPPPKVPPPPPGLPSPHRPHPPKAPLLPGPPPPKASLFPSGTPHPHGPPPPKAPPPPPGPPFPHGPPPPKAPLLPPGPPPPKAPLLPSGPPHPHGPPPPKAPHLPIGPSPPPKAPHLPIGPSPPPKAPLLPPGPPYPHGTPPPKAPPPPPGPPPPHGPPPLPPGPPPPHGPPPLPPGPTPPHGLPPLPPGPPPPHGLPPLPPGPPPPHGLPPLAPGPPPPHGLPPLPPGPPPPHGLPPLPPGPPPPHGLPPLPPGPPPPHGLPPLPPGPPPPHGPPPLPPGPPPPLHTQYSMPLCPTASTSISKPKRSKGNSSPPKAKSFGSTLDLNSELLAKLKSRTRIE